MRITCADGALGAGYTYTIGTGGSSVVALLRDHLAPRLIGRDADARSRRSGRTCSSTRTRPRSARSPAWRSRRSTPRCGTCSAAAPACRCGSCAGGAQPRVPVYTTEGGWLHHSARAARRRGAWRRRRTASAAPRSRSAGRRSPRTSRGCRRCARPSATRSRSWSTRTRRSPSPRRAAARTRSRRSALAWLEEPLPAEDLGGHVELAAVATMPIAVGESLYHPAHFREYLERGACSIVQVDCARIGGITPWLKVAHLAEAFNVAVCPHFLMELHVSLTAAVPNGAWVEYIPQLDAITTSRIAIEDGYARAAVGARPRHRVGLRRDRCAAPSRARPSPLTAARRTPMLTRTSLTIRLHPERRRRHRPRAARRRHQAARRERHRRRPRAARPQGRDARDRARASRCKRYNQIIGFASRDIAPGEHVHLHNLAMGDVRRATTRSAPT